MAVKTMLLLVYLFSVGSAYILMDDDITTDALILPSEYYLKAEKIDLIKDIREPIEIWYSAEYNRSRIDVAGGMVQRYYYWEEYDTTGEEGIVYTVSPKTTEKERNVMTCFKKSISEEAQNHEAFPVEGAFVYAGNRQHEGRQLDVWEDIEEEEDTRTENVMYTYKGARDVDVPVQIVKKEFNTLKGTMDTHLIFNYYDYQPMICYEDLDAEKDSDCEVSSDDFHGTLQVLHPAIHSDVNIAFDSFKKHHNREYRSKVEHEMRKEIFHKNWQLVMAHNSKNLGFKLAINHLSDLSVEELRRRNGARASPRPAGSVPFPHSEAEVDALYTQLPKEYDMRLEGFISPVKDQGFCGSCWAFATTAAVEGTLARLDGRILDLSEQTLVDCSWDDNDDNAGCEGGFPQRALRYVMKNGLPLEEDYGGYLAQNGYCHAENATKLFKIRGFALATPENIRALKLALYKYGPVVVSMQTNELFSLYSSGIFDDPGCEGNIIDHAVTIVGYGVRDGIDYWIVKNSYGQQWGEGGYILLSLHGSNCLVLTEPYYPVV